MKLFKWDKNFAPKFSNMVEKFFGDKINVFANKDEEVSTIPATNISDEEKAFDISLAVPGIDKKDINIEIIDNKIYITSEKQYEKEEQDKFYYRKEFGYASFQRIFELPPEADAQKISADLKDGILNIKVAKDKKYLAKKKKIAIA